MHLFTTQDKKNKKEIRFWAILFWVAIWQLASMKVGQEILLVSPVSVLDTLSQLVKGDFWSSIVFSLSRIAKGFLFAVFGAVCLAVPASRFLFCRQLFAPAVTVIKTTPVASFVILALLWIPSRNLSIFISFLMCFPILYSNVLKGIEETDENLLEMADLFRVPIWKRVRAIYFPQVLPYFTSACSVALGLCWKSGIAAEIIGVPKGSIGEKLYNSKIYLNTSELFAWTIVIITISILFEKCFLWILRIFAGKLAASKEGN